MPDDSPLLSRAEDIVTELEMTREKYATYALVLVEGRTDKALLDEYKHPHCCLIDTGSKEKSLQAITIVEEECRLNGVAAIVDLDCWIVTKPGWLENESILYDDTPDTEMMVLDSRALEKYLRHAMTGQDDQSVLDFAGNLRRTSRRLGIELGYFRTVHCFDPRQGLLLSALENNIASFIAFDPFEIKRDKVASSLTAGLGNICADQLLERVEQLRAEYPAGGYFRGKDILAILVMVFESVFRLHFSDDDLLSKLKTEIVSRQGSQASSSISERLRNAFEERYLMRTALYERIKDWERANTPYQILKQAN